MLTLVEAQKASYNRGLPHAMAMIQSSVAGFVMFIMHLFVT